MIQKIVIFVISLFDFFHNMKIINFLKKKKLTNFNIFFDVGAHKGESIKLFLKNFKIKEIFSFEASPINFEILKDKELSLKKKFSNTNIKVENKALGSISGQKVILNQMRESSSSTINQIDKNSKYFKRKFKFLNLFNKDNVFKPIEIELDTLSNYILINKIKSIDFLKIDTEGYEYEVLLGLKDNFDFVKIIMFEHHYDNMIKKNYSYTDINNLLVRKNFKMIYKAKMPFRKTFEYIFIKKN